jgi:imidazolonepropionase-like amidohydrolase
MFRFAARGWLAVALLVAAAAAVLVAQSSEDEPGNFLAFDDPVVVLTHARVIDGTGAPARDGQTILIRNGVIAGLGADLQPPADARVLDLTGKSVLPGLVMVHEHMFYPTGPSVYGQLGESFVRLYLAGGVTTLRTAGNLNGIMDINLARATEDGTMAGPAIDATAPYLDGPNHFLQQYALEDAADARRQVDYWADMGATSFKAYTHITRAELGAAIAEAHRRHLKVTGHLCSVTYSEAADLGIDNLEHGFVPATDFVADKPPDVCPGQSAGEASIAALDERGALFQSLVRTLVDHHVALTSTLTVFETLTPGRPLPPGLDVLVPALRERFERIHAEVDADRSSVYTKLFPKEMALERAFVAAGGTLLAGTDPTGIGGVVPGYADQRELELLVEAGFTPLEGARYLGRDNRIGTVAVGKQADLVVVDGDPSRNIADLAQVELVLRGGLGYDPAQLIASVRGQVGLW